MVQSISTAQHSTAQHSTAQHSTAQHSTAQHSTAQHSTAQHKVVFAFFQQPQKHLRFVRMEMFCNG
ncbi:hypothetical protein ACS6YI_00870 [Streptococcus suis]|nr:hypothetical protein [Streptococcus suis]